jgi:hypothetical protein
VDSTAAINVIVDNNCSFLAMQYDKQLAAGKLFLGTESWEKQQDTK